MPHYNFQDDLPIAKKTEVEVSKILENRHNAKIIAFDNTNKCDIIASINGKECSFEVKEDFTCERTGNVGLEFECRGKPSGISVSQADFYVYKIHTPKDGIVYLCFKTGLLKNMIKDNLYFRTVSGGDIGSNSKNYLFKLDVFLKYGFQL